jgi:MATE family multidrug resistance protein
LIRHITGFRDTLRRIVLVGAPLLISQMSQYLMSLADTAMIGRLGAESLASIAIGAKTSWLLFVFVWPVSVGVQAIVARRHGRNETGNHDNVALSPVLGAGLIYAAIASGLSLGLSFLAKPVYGAVLSSPAVTDGAMEYLLYVRWAVPFLGAGMIVQGFMNAMRRTRIVMVITVVTKFLERLVELDFHFREIRRACDGHRRSGIGHFAVPGDTGDGFVGDVRLSSGSEDLSGTKLPA